MKTGLVLEGGALRAIFSSGVCDALLDGGVMADYVIGVSAGIAYGVSYVSRQPRRNLDIVTRYAPDPRYMGMRNLRDKQNRSYFGLDFTYNVIPNKLVPFDYKTFAAYPGEVEAVVTYLDTGRAGYLPVPRERGDFKLLQATCALPLMFPVIEVDGRPCMDGGIADAIPWQRALDQGCDRVLAVLSHPLNYVRQPDKLLPLVRRTYRDYPSFIASMEGRVARYNESHRRLLELEQEGRVKVIAPASTLGVSRTERDTEKLRLLWAEGYQMAVDRMDELRAYFTR